MSDLQKHVEKMIEKAASAVPPHEAQALSQAALNAAHAVRVLAETTAHFPPKAPA